MPIQLQQQQPPQHQEYLNTNIYMNTTMMVNNNNNNMVISSPSASTMTTIATNGNNDQLNSSSGSIQYELDDEHVITTLYVHNLDRAVPQQDVLKIFEQYGELEPNECIFFYPQRISSSYAFVRYKNRNDAEQALDAMNGAKIGSLPISIKWSDSCDQRTSIHLTFNPKFAKPGFHKQVFHKCREFGKVNHYNIPRRKGVVSQSNIYEGFGFVHFKDSLNGRCAAQDAINYFNQYEIGGVKINCCFSKKKLNVPSMPAATNAIINDLNNNYYNQQIAISNTGLSSSSSIVPNHLQSQQQHGMMTSQPIAPIPQIPFSAHSLLPDTNYFNFSGFNTNNSNNNSSVTTNIPIPSMRTSPLSSTHTTPNISPNVSPTFRQDKFTGQDIYTSEYFQPCQISEPLTSSISGLSNFMSSSNSSVKSFDPMFAVHSPPLATSSSNIHQQQQQHRKSPVMQVHSPPPSQSTSQPPRHSNGSHSPLSYYFGDSSRDKIFSESDEVIKFNNIGSSPSLNLHEVSCRLSNSLSSIPVTSPPSSNSSSCASSNYTSPNIISKPSLSSSSPMIQTVPSMTTSSYLSAASNSFYPLSFKGNHFLNNSVASTPLTTTSPPPSNNNNLSNYFNHNSIGSF